MNHMSLKQLTQANTPVSGDNYIPEQGKVMWCLNNELQFTLISLH